MVGSEDDIVIEEIEKIGKSIIEETQRNLFIGSGNVASDVTRTAGWSNRLTILVRNYHTWRKNEESAWEMDKTESVDEKLKNEFSEEYSRQAAIGARSFVNKAGNCSEMVRVSLYLLFKQVSENKALLEKLANGDLSFSIDMLTKPYDHELLKVTYKGKNFYIDLWLRERIVYGDAEIEIYKSKIVKKLLDENLAMLEKLAIAGELDQEILDTMKKELPDIYENGLEGFNSISYLTINNPKTFKLYSDAFRNEIEKLRYGDISNLRQGILTIRLLKAINENKSISSYIKQGAIINSEVLNAVAKKDNPEILYKILSGSKYFLGSSALIDHRIVPNLLAGIYMKDDHYYILRKDIRGFTFEVPITLGSKGIKLGDIEIALSVGESLDDRFEKMGIIDNINYQRMRSILNILKYLQKEAELLNTSIVHLMMERNDKDMEELVLNHTHLFNFDLKIDKINDAGKTELMCAIENNQSSMIEFLLKNDADVLKKDPLGRTVLDIAIAHDVDPEIIKILQEKQNEALKKISSKALTFHYKDSMDIDSKKTKEVLPSAEKPKPDI